MTELTCMINGACTGRRALAELGEYGLDLALTVGALSEAYPGVLVADRARRDPLTRISAAWLAVGGSAVATGRVAAWLHGCIEDVGERMTFVRPHRAGRPPPEGVEIRRAVLSRQEHTSVRGIPVLTVPRLIADLRANGEIELALAVQRSTSADPSSTDAASSGGDASARAGA